MPRSITRPLHPRTPPASALPGYEVLVPNAGIGKTSVVSKVRRLEDGAVYAWKVPLSDDAETLRALDLQIERSREWVRVGVSRAESVRAPDGRTLLQPWIEGMTLRRAARLTPLLTDPTEPRHVALVAMLRRLAESRTFVSGLNPVNLCYEDGEWHVVDSGDVRICDSPSEAWEVQRSDLVRKWTRGPQENRMRDVETFLRAADAALALPPLPFSLRRLWRRIRGR